jgi:glycosyltransferase involved in cell wall biosynthesis
MPEVSIVIPAFNAAETVGQTIDSVLAQTFSDFEAIVVDDGSTDATAAVALASEDPRVRLVSVARGGVSRARNTGVAASRSPLVAFLDADDIWLPDKLERQVALLRARPSIGICVTGAEAIDSKGRYMKPLPLFVDSEDYTSDLLLHSSIAGRLSSAVMRRELLGAVGGFDPALQYCEDWLVWLRISLLTSFGVISQPLLQSRLHAGNTSGDPYVLERDTFRALDIFFAGNAPAKYLGMRKRAYGTHWMVCAGSYLHQGHPTAALRCLCRGMMTHPASVRIACGLPVRWAKRRLHRRTGSRP